MSSLTFAVPNARNENCLFTKSSLKDLLRESTQSLVPIVGFLRFVGQTIKTIKLTRSASNWIVEFWVKFVCASSIRRGEHPNRSSFSSECPGSKDLVIRRSLFCAPKRRLHCMHSYAAAKSREKNGFFSLRLFTFFAFSVRRKAIFG